MIERTAGRDVLITGPGVTLSDEHLQELRAVLDEDARTACVVPVLVDGAEAAIARAALAGLPRSSEVTQPGGACALLRREVSELVGEAGDVRAFFAAARQLGFVARRANRAVAIRAGAGGAVAPATLDEALPSLALRVQASGKLRVALDLRHLGPVKMGTMVYALSLANALARAPEVALTVVVREPQQLDLPGARIVTEERRLEGVDVLHKPSQVFDARDLELLFGSPAALVITHQDLIAHRLPAAFPSEEAAAHYRSLSHAVVHAAQRIVCFSRSTQAELVRSFGLSPAEIAPVPIGIDQAGLDGRREERRALRAALGLPPRYFLAVGTDYPHKNLRFVVDAYRHARRDRDFPALVLAGTPSGVAGSFYEELRTHPVAGVMHLSAIDDEQVAALYQGAVALVFASVYEGFGLPPLEAMAAGTPVVALPISAVGEVCGAAPLYPDGFSPRALAAALERIAASAAVRAERIEAGRRQVATLTTQRMLAETLAAYRAAIFRPSERSLEARRHLDRRVVDTAWRVDATRMRTELERVNHSVSFRIGMAVTAPLRWLVAQDWR